MSNHTDSTDTTGDRPVASGADALPTPEDETFAEEAAATAPDVSEAYQAAAKTGAQLKGEGEIK